MIAIPILQEITSLLSNVTQESTDALNEILGNQVNFLNSVASNSTSLLNGLIPRLLSVPLLSSIISKHNMEIIHNLQDLVVQTQKLVEKEIEATNDLVQDVSKQLETVISELQELVSNAVGNGNNATTECAASAEESVNDMVTSVVSSISNCTLAAQQALVGSFNTINSSIMQSFQNIQKLVDETLGCGLNPICLTTMVAKYPKEVNALVAILSNFQKNLLSQIGTNNGICAEKADILIEDSRNAITAAFQSCISA